MPLVPRETVVRVFGRLRTARFPSRSPSHPGNIFWQARRSWCPAGDWAGPWRVMDYDGKQVAARAGRSRGRSTWASCRSAITRSHARKASRRSGLACSAAAGRANAEDFADRRRYAAVPWSLGQQTPEAANLCALAGINWAAADSTGWRWSRSRGSSLPTNNTMPLHAS